MPVAIPTIRYQERYTDKQRVDALASGLMIWTTETFIDKEWQCTYFVESFGVGRFSANELRAAIDHALDARGSVLQ